MGKVGTKLPNFCLNRIRPHVRVRSPPTHSKLDVPDVSKTSGEDVSIDNSGAAANGGGGGGVVVGRKIMIVVDSSFEAKGALQWALSHTVQSQDQVVLLHVTRPSNFKQGGGEGNVDPRAYELVHSLKKMCQLKRPEVHIEVVVVVEGSKEKGPTILEEAKKQEVAMLVLGQKKRSTTWRLLMIWAGNKVNFGGGSGGVVEYCIQNASCMAVAVRRKNRKVGGYLITTKRQKDFWLLA